MKKAGKNIILPQINGELIACDAMVGKRNIRSDLADLHCEMHRLGITGAVVRHGGSLRTAPDYFNSRLPDALEEDIIPAFFVRQEPEIESKLRSYLNTGIRIVWSAAKLAPYGLPAPLSPWFAGELLGCLSDMRVPLMLDYEEFDFEAIHGIMSSFPDLRVIWLNLPRLGNQPVVDSLLELHPELYLGFTPSFSVHRGYYSLCRKFGPYRWVWGSGYPEAEGGAALLGLLGAGLAENEVKLIGAGNIKRLISEVKK
ncbi:MAG: hypothetical protein BWY31_00500 [Lentisphaerae bacterium ADurb.Bin242]|nr:MAG: hypothetical protein BWY31_00500 [Lentisphaerae bacterium ADurb.Bin242]